MKAFGFERYGDPAEVLELREIPTPVPSANQVRVRIRAASINDWEWQAMQGELTNRILTGLFSPKAFKIHGCDIAGEVDEVGPGISQLRPGDRVFGDLSSVGFGAFAEFVCVPPEALRFMPTGMSFEQAASLPQAGMLAVQSLLDEGHLQSGQRLLINGAGGGVGTIGIQIARTYDDVHITAVDSAMKLAPLRELGADVVIDYRTTDFTRTSERYDLVVDTKTNRSPSSYARVLSGTGKYLTVGGRIGRLVQLFALSRIVPGRRESMGVVALHPNKDLDYLSELFERGALVPVIDRGFSFEALPEAMAYYGRSAQFGKVVVTI